MMWFQRSNGKKWMSQSVKRSVLTACKFYVLIQAFKRLRWLSMFKVFGVSMLLTACIDVSPYDARLPADLSKRPAKLEKAMKMLAKDDQAMLTRYMLRKKLSSSYNKGAPPRSRTIKAALHEQQQYEAEHPHDPTGKVAYLKHINGVTNDSNQRLLVSILRFKELPDDFNHVEIQLVFSNAYEQPINAFSGTVRLQDIKNEASFVDIAISESFLTPIAAEDSRKVRYKLSISEPVIMKAIKNLANVRVSLVSAHVEATDEQQYRW